MARSTPSSLASFASFASFALSALVLGASASGCSSCDKPSGNAVDAAPNSSATPASSSVTALNDATAPDGGPTGADDPARRGGGRRGATAVLFHSARTLEPALTPEQKKKVDEADAAVDPASDVAARDAAKELNTELVAGIKAGKIDPAKMEPKYAALEKIAAAEHEKDVVALNALYAALDPAQRTAVVASVRDKQAKRDEQMAGRSHGDGGANGGRPSGSSGKARLERLTRGLELDVEQQKKVDALVPKDDGKSADPTELLKKRTEALLAAFGKDGFDAKKSDGFDAKRHRAMLEEETKLVAQILPILKPEQREKLAARMDRGPGSHVLPRRPGGMGNPPPGTRPGRDEIVP